jgi:hypothetical protein
MRVFDQGGFVLDLSDNGSFECTGNLRCGDSEGAYVELYARDNSSVVIGDNWNIEDDGEGLIEVSGGLLQIGNHWNWGCRRSSVGVTLTLSDGQVIVNGDINADRDNRDDAVNEAVINVSGGSMEVGGTLRLPDHDEGKATLDMTGGSVVVNTLQVGRGESTVINLHGGELDVASLNRQGDFSLDITTGTMILDGDQRAAIEADAAAGNITAYGDPPRGTLLTDYDGINPGRTTVWAEPHFDRAYNPDPPHKAAGLGSRDNIVLSWLPGDGAVFHHVFFGDNYDDVLNEEWTCQLTGPGGQAETSIEVAAPFQLNTPYYWKIVEQDAHLGLAHGWVWKFTIEDGRVIDGMEDYSANPEATVPAPVLT